MRQLNDATQFRLIKLVFLEEAKHAPTSAARRENLVEAKRQFIAASQVDLPRYPLLPIKATFYVGVCHDLLHDGPNALRWYEKSHEMVIQRVSATIRKRKEIRQKFRPSSERYGSFIKRFAPAGWPFAVQDAPNWTPQRFSKWVSWHIGQPDSEGLTPVAYLGFNLTKLIAARKE